MPRLRTTLLFFGLAVALLTVWLVEAAGWPGEARRRALASQLPRGVHLSSAVRFHANHQWHAGTVRECLHEVDAYAGDDGKLHEASGTEVVFVHEFIEGTYESAREHARSIDGPVAANRVVIVIPLQHWESQPRSGDLDDVFDYVKSWFR